MIPSLNIHAIWCFNNGIVTNFNWWIPTFFLHPSPFHKLFKVKFMLSSFLNSNSYEFVIAKIRVFLKRCKREWNYVLNFSKIDGFRGTHANDATVMILWWFYLFPVLHEIAALQNVVQICWTYAPNHSCGCIWEMKIFLD